MKRKRWKRSGSRAATVATATWHTSTVATVDVCQDSVPTDLSSTIRLIVREELRRHLYAPLNAREPPCDTPSTSINATSFEERSYSNRGPQLRAPPPASSYVEPPYAPHSRYGYNSHPPPFASQWEQSAAYPQHPATFPMPRERPVCYQCGVRGHIARFCPMRRNPRSTFPQRSATFAQRSQRPDYTYWPPNPTDERHAYQPINRSDSPGSVLLCCILAVAASAPVEEYPPQPYSFSYDTTDEFGTRLTREETGDANNYKVGSYSYTDPNGITRTVKYTADAEGFHVTVETNEPGTTSSNPADALYSSAAVDVAPAPATPVVAKPVVTAVKPVVVKAAQVPIAVPAAPVSFATAHHVAPVAVVHPITFTLGKAKA
ncbi:hypothetical protein HPB51_027372 [Rhipicephalus microplus]|uniref:CCHC-type domain-containing protein n=1 Tax=Rhipicephalus microplus TaxID=6941 RepID=A0A9J6D096_RHIMP|nr:hypothetical protein HPB51_027372 [Rhipicephalus microplus]